MSSLFLLRLFGLRSHGMCDVLAGLPAAVLLLLTSGAVAQVVQPLLEEFREFATSDLITFGAPKTIVLSFEQSPNGYFVHAGGITIGSAVPFERCLVQKAEAEDVKIKCYEGIFAALDLCKIDQTICEKEGLREKVRELSMDPDFATGKVMRTIGRRDRNPHIRVLTKMVQEYSSARRALGQAMALNGCSRIELGDIDGQTTYLEANPLGDDDTGELNEGAQNRWRAILRCRAETSSVYLDVLYSVANGEILSHLVPIKAAPAERVLIKKLTPVKFPKGTVSLQE